MTDATQSLHGKHLLLVGATSGIGARIALDAVAAGATVTMAGRDPDAAREATAALGKGVGHAEVDLEDEQSVAALPERTGPVDHVVNLAGAAANVRLADLGRAAVVRALDAKVIGAILLAKHYAPLFPPGASMLLFSGYVAWRPVRERAVMATVNGAVSFLAAALAVEMAPVRVNAIAPGVIDSGAWDRLGSDKEAFLRRTAEGLPVRRVGRPEDIAAAALMTLANPFMTGTTVHVDGGGRL